jgi:hypothetical protein
MSLEYSFIMFHPFLKQDSQKPLSPIVCLFPLLESNLLSLSRHGKFIVISHKKKLQSKAYSIYLS